MVSIKLAEKIYEKAIPSGFDDCGIISLEEMDGYKNQLLERMDRVPKSKEFYQRISGIANIKEHFFWDEGSGADGSHKEFLRLMEEIKKGHIHVVVTRDAAMIARDWKQFLEFMKICDRSNMDVVSIIKEADAWKQYSRIRQFMKDYFGEESLA